jgi:tetratricopeptide (TPR) repeat protein
MVGPKLIFKWLWVWGTFPVKAWIVAADFYKEGQFDKAAKAYELGLTTHAKHPAAVSASLDLAYCYQRLGRITQAEEVLKSIISEHPSLIEAYARFARVKLTLGKAADAVLVLRRAIVEQGFSTELVALLVNAYVENELLPRNVGAELREIVDGLSAEARKDTKLEVAIVRWQLKDEPQSRAQHLETLKSLAEKSGAHIDAIIAWAEELLADGKLEDARTQISRLVKANCEVARMYSLLAETYLADGTSFEPIYAVQHAVKACQLSGWASPRELHVLAESYYHAEDKMGALLVASKALDLGRKQIGVYPRTTRLQKLVDTLQEEGTLY